MNGSGSSSTARQRVKHSAPPTDAIAFHRVASCRAAETGGRVTGPIARTND